jgi:hypothetical protein
VQERWNGNGGGGGRVLKRLGRPGTRRSGKGETTTERRSGSVWGGGGVGGGWWGGVCRDCHFGSTEQEKGIFAKV